MTVDTFNCEGIERISEISFAGLGYDEITQDESFYRVIATSPAVRVLDFQYSPVTDDCLKIISNMNSVEDISICDCGNVTDAGMSHVSRMKSLKSINLSFTGITINGARKLSRLKNLEEVHFGYVQYVQPIVLDVFADLEKLHSLHVPGMVFTPADVRLLENLTRLRKLRLSSCEGIDDASVEAISQLTGLEHLNIAATNVTEDGIDRLKRALGRCKIVV